MPDTPANTPADTLPELPDLPDLPQTPPPFVPSEPRWRPCDWPDPRLPWSDGHKTLDEVLRERRAAARLREVRTLLLGGMGEVETLTISVTRGGPIQREVRARIPVRHLPDWLLPVREPDGPDREDREDREDAGEG